MASTYTDFSQLKDETQAITQVIFEGVRFDFKDYYFLSRIPILKSSY